MIEIELFDGTVLEFPEGTPQDVLDRVAKQETQARSQPNTNPGISPEAPPEMFLNPSTGQYTSRELITNMMMQNQTAPTTAMGATIMGAGRGATLGGIDEISGWINAITPGIPGILEPGGGNMAERNTFGREYARAAEDAGQQSNPDDMFTSEIAGALSLPVGALWQGGKLLPKMGGSVLSGIGLGATYGGLTGEGAEDRVAGAREGAAYGAAAGVATPLLGAGVQKVADKRAAKNAIREAIKGANTTAATRAASGRAYDAFEDAGAELSPEAFSRLRETLETRLPQEGLGTLPGATSRTPGGQQILNTVGMMDDQVRGAAKAGQNPAVPFKSVEELRRFAGDVAQDVNPVGRATADARMGSIAIDEIDNFVNTLQSADVPIGDPEKATAALMKARKLWAQASKTQLLDNVLDAQDDYLGGPASAIRNKVGTLLRNPKTRRQFSEPERELLRKIIGGNAVTRAIRLAGNGIGRQLQMVAGAGFGGIPGMLAGVATGELSSAFANKKAVNAAQTVRNLIANGGLERLPVASGQGRQIIEELVRRAGATAPQ